MPIPIDQWDKFKYIIEQINAGIAQIDSYFFGCAYDFPWPQSYIMPMLMRFYPPLADGFGSTFATFSFPIPFDVGNLDTIDLVDYFSNIPTKTFVAVLPDDINDIDTSIPLYVNIDYPCCQDFTSLNGTFENGSCVLWFKYNPSHKPYIDIIPNTPVTAFFCSNIYVNTLGNP